MKLYVCYGTFPATPRPGGHPCGNAHRALKEAGHDPEVVRSYGLGMLPDALQQDRAAARRSKRADRQDDGAGARTDDGEAIYPSQKIVEWAEGRIPAPDAA